MPRISRRVGSVLIAAGALAACSDAGSAVCLSSGAARVCGEAVEGALRMTGEGLQPGSAVRIDVAGIGPAEWTVTDDGTIENEPGSLGFLSFTGSFGTITVAAVADDGTPVAGTITLD